ncbi:MAG: hypothetical protein EBU36_03920 [Verrucomicrobia bacterium]|nr:hypothetical protein [Verrucomicrobiota bacterium]
MGRHPGPHLLVLGNRLTGTALGQPTERPRSFALFRRRSHAGGKHRRNPRGREILTFRIPGNATTSRGIPEKDRGNRTAWLQLPTDLQGLGKTSIRQFIEKIRRRDRSRCHLQRFRPIR